MRTSAVIAALVSVVLGGSPAAQAASCYCKIIAKMGQLQERQVGLEQGTCTQVGGLLPPGCKSYCQAVFDSQKTALAALYPNACQNVYMKALAACGTAAYKQVDSGYVNVGGTFVCPPGQWIYKSVECVTTTPCGFLPNTTNFNQLLQEDGSAYPRYFIYKNNLYRITGPATCQY